jgi:hypothetical protein
MPKDEWTIQRKPSPAKMLVSSPGRLFPSQQSAKAAGPRHAHQPGLAGAAGLHRPPLFVHVVLPSPRTVQAKTFQLGLLRFLASLPLWAGDKKHVRWRYPSPKPANPRFPVFASRRSCAVLAGSRRPFP